MSYSDTRRKAEEFGRSGSVDRSQELTRGDRLSRVPDSTDQARPSSHLNHEICNYCYPYDDYTWGDRVRTICGGYAIVGESEGDCSQCPKVKSCPSCKRRMN